MIPSPPFENGLPVPLIEGGLTLIAVAAVFRWPRRGHTLLSRIEGDEPHSRDVAAFRIRDLSEA